MSALSSLLVLAYCIDQHHLQPIVPKGKVNKIIPQPLQLHPRHGHNAEEVNTAIPCIMHTTATICILIMCHKHTHNNTIIISLYKGRLAMCKGPPQNTYTPALIQTIQRWTTNRC